ncbi:DUF2314 domain-containing protein [Phenylobacterium sp. LjRoot225]|uniref:DUF2314 domain-containing protein n=1 Tax=Phenylobacterium sp. LjRoot225 TaxID=3342285 RepID=UPI003ED04635
MLGGTACTRKAEADDGTILISPDDQAVNAAKSEAIKALPVFWAKFDAKEPGASHYLVKVALHAKGGGDEVVWAEPLQHAQDDVVVRLANQPVYLAEPKLGDVIHVPPEDLVDWSYLKNGKLYGHFVTRSMMNRAKPEERALMEANLAPTPLESDVN